MDVSVLVAVSGGADSLALLFYLHESGYPLVCASFNHQLRPDAAADVAFVCEISTQLGVPFVSGSADVAAFAREEKLSIEEAARKARYRFLFSQADKVGAQAVATGHTADDQAETVLMHFLRGAGLAGLKGMLPRVVMPEFDREIPLVRPLLGWTRAQTEEFCRVHGLVPRTDATNADPLYLRNSLRLELLPELEKYNPQVRQSLARMASLLQGDYELINEALDAAWQETFAGGGAGYVSFSQTALAQLAPAMRRHALRRAVGLLLPSIRDVGFDVLERAAAFTLKPQPRRLDMTGGVYLLHENGLLYLTFDDKNLPLHDYLQLEGGFPLENGIFDLGNDWQISASEVEGHGLFEMAISNGDPLTAWLDADLTAGKLRVAAMRAGQRAQPLGMNGQTVSLQDLFVNLKIPRRFREKWPLVLVGDEVAWVAGLRLCHPFRVTGATRRAVSIKIKRKT